MTIDNALSVRVTECILKHLKSGRGKRKTFTLIELLVVIAIIAILASLLFPALKEARKLAKNVKCQSNLRQIGLAYNMYAGDFDGFLPYLAKAGGKGANNMKRSTHWGCDGCSGNPCNYAEYHMNRVIESYLPPSNAYFCPFENLSSYKQYWPHSGGCGNYYKWKGYVSFIPKKNKPGIRLWTPGGSTVYDSTKVINHRIGDYPKRPIAGDYFACEWLNWWEGSHVNGKLPRSGGYPGRGNSVDANSIPGASVIVTMNWLYSDGSVVSSNKVRWVEELLTYWHVRQN